MPLAPGAKNWVDAAVRLPDDEYPNDHLATCDGSIIFIQISIVISSRFFNHGAEEKALYRENPLP
jgi:hypothetical protein